MVKTEIRLRPAVMGWETTNSEGLHRPSRFSSSAPTRLGAHRLQLPIYKLMQTDPIPIVVGGKQCCNRRRSLPSAGPIRTVAVRVPSKLGRFDQLLSLFPTGRERNSDGNLFVLAIRAFGREGAGAGSGAERRSAGLCGLGWRPDCKQARCSGFLGNVFGCAKRPSAAQDAFRTPT